MEACGSTFSSTKGPRGGRHSVRSHRWWSRLESTPKGLRRELLAAKELPAGVDLFLCVDTKKKVLDVFYIHRRLNSAACAGHSGIFPLAHRKRPKASERVGNPESGRTTALRSKNLVVQPLQPRNSAKHALQNAGRPSEAVCLRRNGDQIH